MSQSSQGPRKRLPANPSIEHLKKQAKRKLRDLQGSDPSAKLATAQHQLADEYGCKNWENLVQAVEAMRREAGAKKDFEPLPQAARNVDLVQVRQILREGDLAQRVLDQALAFALWYATESDWPERKAIADVLLEHGADPGGEYSETYGPIVFGACECLQPLALQYLMEAGADVAFAPGVGKYGGECPLSVALGTYVRGRNARKHQVIDILLGHGAYLPPEVSAPILAIHRGSAKELGGLLDADPALVFRRFASMPYGNMRLKGATLLHCAVEFGEIECLEELVKRHADINAKADVIDGLGGQTPVFHAVNTNCDTNFSILEDLVKRFGSEIDMTVRATWNSYGDPQRVPMTPLEYSARKEKAPWRSKAAEELALLHSLDAAAAIKEAISREDLPAVGRLLDEHPDLLAPALWPLAIYRAKSLTVTRLLLERGLNPNECSAPRRPLHLAVYQGLPEIVELLLAYGADACQLNSLGERPLDLLDAYEPRPVGDFGTRRIREALVAAGAPEDVFCVARLGDTERLARMLEANPELASLPPGAGLSPLDAAARSGRVEAVRVLLEHGAPVNGANDLGNTPLWFACQSSASPAERVEIARLLLDAGADLHKRCEKGTTALHFAAWRGPSTMVKLLLSRGARHWIGDDKGKLPLDYAKESEVSTDKDAIARLLSEVPVLDSTFRRAVDAIDRGEVETLRRLLAAHPGLVHERAEGDWFEGAYFHGPTLLHFVANNPYRQEKMPPRILESAAAILDAGAEADAGTLTENTHTTLGLVASCEPARKDKLQIPLIELLVSRGADPSLGLDAAIVHFETEAVDALLRLGAAHTLVSAAAFGKIDVLRERLPDNLPEKQRLDAACAVAMYGRIDSIEILLATGLDINARLPHPYSPTLLHQAAWFGHRAAVEWLLERGADPALRDSQFDGTPADWARVNKHRELSELIAEFRRI